MAGGHVRTSVVLGDHCLQNGPTRYLTLVFRHDPSLSGMVAHNADPYLELDIPATFSSHPEALEYAIRTAIVFRGAPGAPTGFAISGPDGPIEWPIEALCAHVVRLPMGLLP